MEFFGILRFKKNFFTMSELSFLFFYLLHFTFYILYFFKYFNILYCLVFTVYILFLTFYFLFLLFNPNLIYIWLKPDIFS
jgi:hypothetical protein